jgi:epoxyqueuosine reductase QueG
MHINPQAESKMAEIQKKIVSYLRNLGYRAFPIPPNTVKNPQKFHSILYEFFPHRMAATCAGLGWIGKNGMLINSDLGLRLIWATVLTNAPLIPANPVMETECKDCNLCVEACPSEAIHGVKWSRYENPLARMVDVDACMDQLKFNEKEYGSAACGICTTICPYNLAKPGFSRRKPLKRIGTGSDRVSETACVTAANPYSFPHEF